MCLYIILINDLIISVFNVKIIKLMHINYSLMLGFIEGITGEIQHQWDMSPTIEGIDTTLNPKL